MRFSFELRWPLAWASTAEKHRRENVFLKDALHEANKELVKHRNLIAGIREGRIDVIASPDRIAVSEGKKRHAS